MKTRFGLATAMNIQSSLQSLATACLCVLLTACGTMRSSVVVEPPPGGTSSSARGYVAPDRRGVTGGSYEVRRGDTLYSIAFRNGVDFRDLAQWNGVAAPYTIWPGQRLILSPSHGSDHARAGSEATGPAPVASSPVFTSVAPVRDAAEPAASRSSASKPVTTAPAARRGKDNNRSRGGCSCPCSCFGRVRSTAAGQGGCWRRLACRRRSYLALACGR